eukprot:355400-Chlamydomonas_euryale.AAC.5
MRCHTRSLLIHTPCGTAESRICGTSAVHRKCAHDSAEAAAAKPSGSLPQNVLHVHRHMHTPPPAVAACIATSSLRMTPAHPSVRP